MFVLQKKNRDINSSFTIRKISFGEGVERTFALYSPIIGSIQVIRSGQVRRSKLYYLRDRTGKSARIVEKVKKKIGINIEVKLEEEKKESKKLETSISEDKKDIKTLLKQTENKNKDNSEKEKK